MVLLFERFARDTRFPTIRGCLSSYAVFISLSIATVLASTHEAEAMCNLIPAAESEFLSVNGGSINGIVDCAIAGPGE
jgi:hypothetical protein